MKIKEDGRVAIKVNESYPGVEKKQSFLRCDGAMRIGRMKIFSPRAVVEVSQTEY